MATTTTNAPAMPGAWKVNLPEDLLAALAAFGLFLLPFGRPPFFSFFSSSTGADSLSEEATEEDEEPLRIFATVSAWL